MKRWITFAASGSQVAACGRLGATVPPVMFAWYQRGAANPVVFAATNGVRYPQRLGAAEVGVLVLHHRPDLKYVQQLLPSPVAERWRRSRSANWWRRGECQGR